MIAGMGGGTLYWHLGQKRTGTSSLQAVLASNEHVLAGAGVVYPREWRLEGPLGSPGHHGLGAVVEASPGSEEARAFRRYLEDHRESSLLLSSELATDFLAEPKLEALLRTLELAASIMPVTCIWTLRRLDERINSQRLRRALVGGELIFPRERNVSGILAAFSRSLEGMRRIERVVDGRVQYVRYSPDGSHNEEIMRLAGLPAPLRTALQMEIDSGPRLNAQLTHKGALAVCFRPRIERRAAVRIDSSELLSALFFGDLEFSGDRPCELMGDELRRTLHEGALAAARRVRVDRYVEFFAAEQPEPCAPVTMDERLFGDDDVRRLVECLREAERSRLRGCSYVRS